MPSRSSSRQTDFASLLLAEPAPPVFRAPLMPAAKETQTGAALAEAMAPLARLSGLREVYLHGKALRLPAVRQLMALLAEHAQAMRGRAALPERQTDGAHGAHWRWERRREPMAPVWVARLLLIGQGETPTSHSNGTLTVFLGDLPFTRERLAALLPPAEARASLCVNALAWKPAKGDRLAPLVLQALDEAGNSTIAGDAEAESQIAHAFWHAHWAADSVRQAHGRTFPLAMVPVRRDPEGPLDDEALDLGASTIFGTASITAALLQRLASAGRLVFDPGPGTFGPTSEAGVTDAERRALARLNAIGFYDRHVGGDPVRRIQVARVIPFQSGVALSDVFARWDELAQTGRTLGGPRPLAGINSCFFLNFPEELQSPHSALNDPVSALVLGGVWHSAPLLRRAALLMGTGRAAIRVLSWGDVVLESPLAGKPLVPEGGGGARGIPLEIDPDPDTRPPRGVARLFTPWSAAQTPQGLLTLGTFEPERDRAFIVVGTEIVEEPRSAAVSIPHNGYLLVLPAALARGIPPRLPGSLRRVAIRWRRAADRVFTQVLSCGPVLLSGGRELAADHFEKCVTGLGPEQYLSWEAKSGTTVRRGVVPTRLPLDVTVTRAPRTAVGLTAKGEVILATVDGRADMRHSSGATLLELAQVMKELGCREAVNFDGGGSTSLYLDHPEAKARPVLPGLTPGLTNRPSDRGGVERVLPLPLMLWSR